MSTAEKSVLESPKVWVVANRQVAEIIQTHSRTFYFATNLLPRRKRDAIRILYSFCRKTDDLVDRAGVTQAEMDAYRLEVNQDMETQKDPVLACWAWVRQQYAIDRRYEQELLDGVEMDIRIQSYQTWKDLETYCYRVASTVGLLSMPIIGLAHGARFEQAAPYAIQLGIALQLTNILRDVGEDARRGRIYLPVEDLERFGLSLEDIQNEVYDQRFIDLMKFEIERARQIYRQALPGIALLAAEARMAVGAAGLLYAAILDEIKVIGYRVHTQRAHTSSLQKFSLLPKILWTILTLKKPAV